MFGDCMVNLAINTKNLSKDYGSFRAVNNISLEIERGKFFGFLGPNGAGKTTSMRMMTGRLRPTSGSAEIVGFDVVENNLEVKKRIGVLEDEPRLYDRLTVTEYLKFIEDIYDISSDGKADRLLDLVDLSGKKDSLIVDLSHGQKKKVGLAGEILHEPEILFLDEPFAGIDPVSSRAIKDSLVELTKEGVTIFLSTHILEVAEKLCEEVAIIDEGEILERGDISNLRKRAELDEYSSLEDVFLKLLKQGEEVGL